MAEEISLDKSHSKASNLILHLFALWLYLLYLCYRWHCPIWLKNP